MLLLNTDHVNMTHLFYELLSNGEEANSKETLLKTKAETFSFHSQLLFSVRDTGDSAGKHQKLLLTLPFILCLRVSLHFVFILLALIPLKLSVQPGFHPSIFIYCMVWCIELEKWNGNRKIP